jgi:hypothetical protein
MSSEIERNEEAAARCVLQKRSRILLGQYSTAQTIDVISFKRAKVRRSLKM